MVSLPSDPSRETFESKVAAYVSAGLTIEDARDSVATRHGFSGWAAVRAYADVVQVYRRDNDPHLTTETIPDEFCRLACLTYVDDPPERRAAARELLGVHPELTGEHVWAAAAAGDVEALRRILADQPKMADAPGGPYGWKPLLYLTYSRVNSASEADTVAAARLLLAAGADPNAGYLLGGLQTPFTVLTGVFGEGEQGPGRCPRHPYERALAEVLLTSGADPNDGQTLYNRMFRPDNSHLELLFAHGLGGAQLGPWPGRLGEAADTPRQMIDNQLNWAVAHGYASRVAMLLDRGANPEHLTKDSRRVVEVAAANGDRVSAGLLIEAGAEPPVLNALETLIADCLANDAEAVAHARDTDPQLLAIARATQPCLVARAVDAGRRDAIGLLVWLGFDVNARRDGETALHRCAWNGDIPMARMLLDEGADPNLADDQFDATPLDWAEHSCQTEFIEFIEPLTKRP